MSEDEVVDSVVSADSVEGAFTLDGEMMPWFVDYCNEQKQWYESGDKWRVGYA